MQQILFKFWILSHLHGLFGTTNVIVHINSRIFPAYTFIRSTRLFGTLGLHTGVSSLGVLGVPWHPQILSDQLTLSQPGGQIMPT